MEVINLKMNKQVRYTVHFTLLKLPHAPKYTRNAIVNINHSKPSSGQPRVEQIDHQLVPDGASLLHRGSKRRLALRLAADLLAGAGGPSERPDAVGQPVRFGDPVDQTQDNPREPEAERDLEVLLRALWRGGEEFYLLGLRVRITQAG